MNKIVILEGIDNMGKTSLAADICAVSDFKYTTTSLPDSFIHTFQDYWFHISSFFNVDAITGTSNIVLDRWLPSTFAYELALSKIAEREFDWKTHFGFNHYLEQLEQACSSGDVGVMIIYLAPLHLEQYLMRNLDYISYTIPDEREEARSYYQSLLDAYNKVFSFLSEKCPSVDIRRYDIDLDSMSHDLQTVLEDL